MEDDDNKTRGFHYGHGLLDQIHQNYEPHYPTSYEAVRCYHGLNALDFPKINILPRSVIPQAYERIDMYGRVIKNFVPSPRIFNPASFDRFLFGVDLSADSKKDSLDIKIKRKHKLQFIFTN